MNDWDQFTGDVSWFVTPDSSVVLGSSSAWARGPVAGLPELSSLLGSATVTPVTIDGCGYELLAWGPADHRRGWLTLEPGREAVDDVLPLHRSLLASMGGIVERFSEPASWWCNQNQVLTPAAAKESVAEPLGAISWLWTDHGLEVPIDPADYYVVAVEANGNLTLVHRVRGELVLFAPDHSFEGVTPVSGSPEYSLMTIDGVPDLASWIEVCARAWTGR